MIAALCFIPLMNMTDDNDASEVNTNESYYSKKKKKFFCQKKRGGGEKFDALHFYSCVSYKPGISFFFFQDFTGIPVYLLISNV